MRVPEYIKARMRSVTNHAYRMARDMDVIEKWLKEHGMDVEDLRDGCGCSLEELEYGNDITDELCERIEAMSLEKNAEGA